jgi:predicted tellurium resistance membrane protein TerC
MPDLSTLLSLNSLIALLTLTILEVVLGVDNVIFIAIVTQRLPEGEQQKARTIGLSLALVGRIVMVLGVAWLLGLDKTLFTAFGFAFSLKDLILVAGGLFLVYKAATEIFKTTELTEEEHEEERKGASMMGAVAQIVVIDMVFAVDSVLTAVGMTSQIVLIIIAMTIAVLVMIFYSKPLARFIGAHPSVKMLALAFLVLVGVLMLADGFGAHVDRNYVYFAILFSLAVEALNLRRQKNLRSRRALEKEPTV